MWWGSWSSPGGRSPTASSRLPGPTARRPTVELLGHVYRTAGEPVAVAGNVGTPLSALAGEVDPDATVVCEASSFQLEDSVAFAPECAVFLNLAPDHLDRHADLDAYLAAKLRIFANQGNDDVAVYNADDPALAGVDLGGCARRVAFCRGAGPDCEVAARRGNDLLRRRAAARRSPSSASSASTTSPTRWRPPPRRSRWGSTATPCARACAASPASRTGSSRSPRSAACASSTTPRRPTSPPPTVGLRAFEGGVHAILGGSEKGEPFAPLLDPVRERCVACYLIGAAAERLAEELAPAIAAGVELHRCARPRGRGARAPPPRRAPARSSCSRPACASFDAFENFEAARRALPRDRRGAAL